MGSRKESARFETDTLNAFGTLSLEQVQGLFLYPEIFGHYGEIYVLGFSEVRGSYANEIAARIEQPTT